MDDEYLRIYDDLIEAASAWQARAESEPLTCTWPLSGPDYRPNQDWLYVGQAPNGWGDADVWITATQRPTALAVRDYATSLDEGAEHCLAWAERRDLTQRPFWTIVRRLATDTDAEWTSPGWTRRVAWTNLFKVAPSESEHGVTAQPDTGLREAQRAFARELLVREIEAFSPACIVFLTGRWVDAFDEFEGRAVSEGGTIRSGVFRGRPAVASPHPGWAYRNGYTADSLEAAIIAAAGA